MTEEEKEVLREEAPSVWEWLQSHGIPGFPGEEAARGQGYRCFYPVKFEKPIPALTHDVKMGWMIGMTEDEFEEFIHCNHWAERYSFMVEYFDDEQVGIVLFDASIPELSYVKEAMK